MSVCHAGASGQAEDSANAVATVVTSLPHSQKYANTTIPTSTPPALQASPNPV